MAQYFGNLIFIDVYAGALPPSHNWISCAMLSSIFQNALSTAPQFTSIVTRVRAQCRLILFYFSLSHSIVLEEVLGYYCNIWDFHLLLSCCFISNYFKRIWIDLKKLVKEHKMLQKPTFCYFALFREFLLCPYGIAIGCHVIIWMWLLYLTVRCTQKQNCIVSNYLLAWLVDCLECLGTMVILIEVLGFNTSSYENIEAESFHYIISSWK